MEEMQARSFEATRKRLYKIIFEAETKAGKNFDLLLMIAIIISVLAVILESVELIKLKYSDVLWSLEWFFTILFTIEYFVRIWIVRRPLGYILSFYGIVDFISIIPTYLTLFIPGAQIFVVVRILRLLRMFRILKLFRYMDEAEVLIRALKRTRRKIIVFLVAVLSITVVMGSLIYFVEGAENGFLSIPHGIYWSIVTICTVGYGDIVPQTAFGRFLASILMVMAYGIVAIPTGIFSAELIRANNEANRDYAETTRTCSACATEGHDEDAKFCKHCGEKLEKLEGDKES